LKDIIRYILGDEKLLDDIKELWEALNEHHNEKSLHFKEFYNKFSFDARKADLIKQAQKSHMRVIISFDDAVQKGVGYCISSVDNDNNGEIESIFVLQGYRGFGIGEELMQKGLQWMDEMGAVKKVINVAAGNGQAFGFYERYGFIREKQYWNRSRYKSEAEQAPSQPG
jgi:ribosomal protein S18 acetylase RimI-like enzyme